MFAAVCCVGADELALIDVENGERRGTIGVGADPVHPFLYDDDIWVATMGDRAVSVVTDGDVRRVETGVLGPSHFAAAAGALFVPCTGGDATAVLDPGAGELVGRVFSGTEPHEATVHDGHVYVGSRGDGTVTVADAARAAAGAPDSTVATVDLPPAEDGPARVQGVEAGAGGVFAVDQRGSRVHKVTRRDGVVASATVGTDPYEVTVTPDRVFVSGRASDVVHELGPDLTLIAGHDVAERPTEVVVLERPWVVHRGAARLSALDDGTVVSLPYPAISAVPVGDDLLVSHYDDGAVSLVDVDAKQVRWTTETGANPFGVVVV